MTDPIARLMVCIILVMAAAGLLYTLHISRTQVAFAICKVNEREVYRRETTVAGLRALKTTDGINSLLNSMNAVPDLTRRIERRRLKGRLAGFGNKLIVPAILHGQPVEVVIELR